MKKTKGILSKRLFWYTIYTMYILSLYVISAIKHWYICYASIEVWLFAPVSIIFASEVTLWFYKHVYKRPIKDEKVNLVVINGEIKAP